MDVNPNPAPRQVRIVESYGRGLLRAIRSQFSGPVEAVCELVDNALDHSLGQHVRIDVGLTPSGFGITNIGGRGMGPEELAGYVAWGGGNAYEEGDRGHYGQGGKAALLYLGKGFRLYCKRAGSDEVWLLEDPDVLGGFAGGPRDYGVLSPLEADRIPEDLRGTAIESGFVQIQSVGFYQDLSVTGSELARDLSTVYAPTLRAGAAAIFVNGDQLRAPEVVLDPEVERIAIRVEVDGIVADGWAAKLLKGGNKANPVRPGFTLVWRGRRVRAGVWFGTNPYAKGALAAFYGELEVSGVTPNLNKTGFLEQGEVVWDRLSDMVLEQAAPVLDALRSPGGLASVTSRDLRLARNVRAELEEVLRSLGSHERETYEEEVRVVITHRPGAGRSGIIVSGGTSRGRGPKPHPDGHRRGTQEWERPAPTIPEIIVDSWDAPVRSEVRELSGGGIVIAINKAHPAYASANAKYAIAEGVVTEVFRRGASDVDDFLTSADEALAAWGQRQITSDEDLGSI